ncbi:hypothetical protein FJ250_13790 [bacterium]|nr:hypothetical protein [bacterium]
MREPDADRVPGADAWRDTFDRQVATAAARLREGGVEPARDLWPELAAALDAAGDAHRDAHRDARHGAHTGRRGARPAWPRWSQAALAASVVLAIGLGLTTRGPAPGGTAGAPAAVPADGPAAMATPSPASSAAASPVAAAREGLRAVAAALAEVEAALSQSPDDPDLSRLVLMIHHSRGRLLRLQAESGAREARRSPA